jgi:hypothetical protein
MGTSDQRNHALVVGMGGAVLAKLQIASLNHWVHRRLFSRPPDARQRPSVGARVNPPAG